MTEIPYRQISEVCDAEGPPPSSSTWLIHGEEMLVEKSCERLSRRLQGDAPSEVSRETVEGLPENIPALLEQLNTFALLSSAKVVVFKDAKLVDSKETHQRWLTQIQQAWEKEQVEKAARLLSGLCGRLNVKPAGLISHADRQPELKQLADGIGLDALQRLSRHIVESGGSAESGGDHLNRLVSAIEKGFPPGHHLIVTAHSRVPKNLKFYKTVNSRGTVIDCNVPKGDRRADKTEKDEVLRQTLADLLAPAGKTLAPNLFEPLVQLTGFDIRVFAQNVRKLIDYTGDRAQITSDDIKAVLRRTRNDPIYEFTNAVADRNLAGALFYLKSLLDNDFHPLQMLAAVANQMRKLLIAKDFSESRFGRGWQTGMPFNQFQQQVLPAVIAYDSHYEEQVDAWQQEQVTETTKKEKSGLQLAANPKNPYPVFQTLVKAGNYSRDELVAAVLLLNRTDRRLKSTGQDPVLVMKKTLIDICGRDV